MFQKQFNDVLNKTKQFNKKSQFGHIFIKKT